MNPAGGVFLLIRTDDAGFHDIKRAFELFTGDTPQRKLLGLATADMVSIWLQHSDDTGMWTGT